MVKRAKIKGWVNEKEEEEGGILEKVTFSFCILFHLSFVFPLEKMGEMVFFSSFCWHCIRKCLQGKCFFFILI